MPPRNKDNHPSHRSGKTAPAINSSLLLPAFNTNPAASAVIRLQDGLPLEMNEACLKLFELNRDEIAARSKVELNLWPTPETRIRFLEEIRTLQRIQNREITLQKRSGQSFTVLMSAELVTVEDEDLLITSWIDITDRKKAEEALQEGNRHFQTMTRCMPDTIWSTDLSGCFTYVSPNVERTHGYTPDELLQRSFRNTVTPRQAIESDLLWNKELEAAARPGYDRSQVITYESEECRKDGSTFQAEVTAGFIWSADGQPVGTTGVTRDITDRKRQEEAHRSLEAQLRQSQKMESIGRLAGGVAHDYNNMLGVILGRTEMALDQIDSDHPLHEDLVEIQKAAGRSADLTRQLLAFARKQTIRPKIIDLNEVISGTLKMLRRLIGENIRLEWHPTAIPWPVKMDPSQVDQILANLCVNSRDAISGIGKIKIKTANFVINTETYKGHDGCVPGEYVQISIKDNGCGMNESTLSNIFEPFFTTKTVGEGTGLGLSTVYGIIRQNNGFVHVESRPAEGTTFELYLPRYVGPAETSENPERNILEKTQITVLLVEDEPTVLKLAQAMLQKLGYAVLPAPTPGKALQIADRHHKDIDIIMTDIIMPEMNGRELADKLRSVYPHLQCVFMSGWTADAMVDQGMLDEGTIFLQKPFSMKELAAAFQKARYHK